MENDEFTPEGPADELAKDPGVVVIYLGTARVNQGTS
jgi:hypothetical protein